MQYIFNKKKITLFLISREITTQLYPAARLMSIPARSVLGFPLLNIFVKTCYFFISFVIHVITVESCTSLWYLKFDFNFLDSYNQWLILSNAIQVSIFNCVVSFIDFELLKCFGHQYLTRRMLCTRFLPFCRLFFTLLSERKLSGDLNLTIFAFVSRALGVKDKKYCSDQYHEVFLLWFQVLDLNS